jgi:phage gp36-like protein
VAYATTQDVLDRLGADVALRLAKDPEGELDTAKLERALADATGEVDSYLGQRYSIPVSPVSEQLVRIVLDLAIFQLFMWRGFDPERDVEVKIARDAAVQWLERVARGLAGIGAAEPPKDVGAEVEAATRVFSREKMGDF